MPKQPSAHGAWEERVIAFLTGLTHGESVERLRDEAEKWHGSADMNEEYLSGIALEAAELLRDRP